MVILFELHSTATDEKRRHTFPMTEDTGLEALASPLAGYLGKIQERAASLEHCPWCTSKGLNYALRSYRLNFQDSVTLCTNPECLFPLVSQSLDDVLASLVPLKPFSGCKRKNSLEVEKEDLVEPKSKRLHSSELDRFSPQNITEGVISLADQENHWDSPAANTRCDSLEDGDDKLDVESVNTVSTDGFSSVSAASVEPLQGLSNSSSDDGNELKLSPHDSALGVSEDDSFLEDSILEKSPSKELNTHCSLDLNRTVFTTENIGPPGSGAPAPQHNEQAATMGCKSVADVTFCKDTEGIKSEDLTSTAVIESKEFLPIPNQLFWSNSNNLCWLDSMLVALVKCKSLRKCQPKDETHLSPIWQLIKGYEDICAAIRIHQQPGGDGVVRVPKHVLGKANTDLRSLKMSVFKLLKPRLHCKLGQTETPVFALPLFLAMDPWVEPLFKLSFHWEFKCSRCKTPTKKRVTNTLTSFTNILPDWRPQNAVHLAPCNVCSRKKERRTMKLQRVPPVFGLHFVEGLPDNDVRNYSFTFNEKCYSVTMCIQYNQQLKHFITWIRNSDGSWLEYDDLKHPECKTYQKLPVPAEEIHIVFWEVQEDEEPQACRPSSTFGEPCQSQNEVNIGSDIEDVSAEVASPHIEDHSLLTFHDDSDIISALSASADNMDTTAVADTSIGSTTLLDTFEGLTHNDIITLTLVEIKEASDGQTANDNEQTQDLNGPNRDEIIDSTPDSSSAAIDHEMCDAPQVEPPAPSNSSESDDNSSSDPTFVPLAKGRQKRRKPKRRMDITAASFDLSPHVSSEASESSKTISDKNASAAVAQDSMPDAEATQPLSPMSSTNTPAGATTQSVTVTPVPMQSSRWSFLLSKHHLHRVAKTNDKITPIPDMEVKPTHSTPNPVRRQQFPVGLPKRQLKTEQGEVLPPKAAEMYDSFGAKNSNTSKGCSSPFPSTELHLSVKSKPLHTPFNHQKLPVTTTAMSGTSHPLPKARGLPHVSSSENPFSKVPPGLSQTDVLRYKLMKKLKAKKRKLAKLNEIQERQGGAGARQDSTDLSSPATVTSSTYDGTISDDLLSDLLSPATTASNLSPDSTGFLEAFASGQEALDPGIDVSQVNPCDALNNPNPENFLEDFLSQAVAQRPTEMETEALNALELFI
ncbi:SUMO-specific isopeptidase USPL1 [Antennarius striatus]|uniref:SUMO-specific isopeptidase USPL1 n=1 Tax=Antennarius striatus TaxID=241820 RepID=UPI0035B146BE